MDGPDKPKFNISKVKPPVLAGDLANLGDVDIITYKQALTGSHAAEVMEKTLELLEKEAANGVGLNLEQLPQPYFQSGATCQTYAFINGIQAWGNIQLAASLANQVEEVRQRGTRFLTTNGASSPYSPEAIAYALQEMGAIKFLGEIDGSPIQIARQLFVPGRFLVRSKEASWHATTILPQSSNEEKYAVKIDSMGGEQRSMSSTEFMVIAANRKPGHDKFTLCETTIT